MSSAVGSSNFKFNLRCVLLLLIGPCDVIKYSEQHVTKLRRWKRSPLSSLKTFPTNTTNHSTVEQITGGAKHPALNYLRELLDENQADCGMEAGITKASIYIDTSSHSTTQPMDTTTYVTFGTTQDLLESEKRRMCSRSHPRLQQACSSTYFSCRGRCAKKSRNTTDRLCHCDPICKAYLDCCWDFDAWCSLNNHYLSLAYKRISEQAIPICLMGKSAVMLPSCYSMSEVLHPKIDVSQIKGLSVFRQLLNHFLLVLNTRFQILFSYSGYLSCRVQMTGTLTAVPVPILVPRREHGDMLWHNLKNVKLILDPLLPVGSFKRCMTDMYLHCKQTIPEGSQTYCTISDVCKMGEAPQELSGLQANDKDHDDDGADVIKEENVNKSYSKTNITEWCCNDWTTPHDHEYDQFPRSLSANYDQLQMVYIAPVIGIENAFSVDFPNGSSLVKATCESFNLYTKGVCYAKTCTPYALPIFDLCERPLRAVVIPLQPPKRQRTYNSTSAMLLSPCQCQGLQDRFGSTFPWRVERAEVNPLYCQWRLKTRSEKADEITNVTYNGDLADLWSNVERLPDMFPGCSARGLRLELCFQFKASIVNPMYLGDQKRSIWPLSSRGHFYFSHERILPRILQKSDTLHPWMTCIILYRRRSFLNGQKSRPQLMSSANFKIRMKSSTIFLCSLLAWGVQSC